MDLINIFTREYSVQYTEVSIRALGYEAKKHISKLVLSQAYIPEGNGNEGCYVDRVEWEIFIDSLKKKYSDGDELADFFSRFHKYGNGYVDMARQISKSDLAVVDNKTLASYYKDYQEKIIVYTTYLWLGFLLNNIYADGVKALLEKRGASELVGSVLAPTKLSGILGLQDQLVKIKSGSGRLNKYLVSNLLKKYAWMSCLDIHNNPWTAEELFSFFKSLKLSKQILNFGQAIRKVSLSEKELNFIRLARELVYVKDMRDEYRRQGVYYAIPLFTEMSNRLGVDRKELAYFTQREIVEALTEDKILSRKVSNSRQGGFLIYWREETIYVTSDNEEIDSFIKGNVSKKDNDANSLKGMPASIGFAKGKIKIVRGVKDLYKVEKEDIMVAITTHPDYISAMHRAAAIVTDEGGLTSHAAIVSRELNIPCIVGAKLATKILKDGQLVEVDAGKGVITLI